MLSVASKRSNKIRAARGIVSALGEQFQWSSVAGRQPGLPVNGKGEGFETIGRVDLFPEVWWTGEGGQGVVARVGESLLLF